MSTVRHLVSHTHWDREWYRTFQQFRIRLVRLIDRLFDILAKDECYAHFMLDGQAILLEDYLEIRPERADDISHWVRAGRLSIGPWYVLPDEFLVAPEALVRNLMMGDRVCRRFGGAMPVGYVPDLFGHISQLPQILRGFAIDSAVMRRGLAVDPVELTWEAPNGSSVLVCYLRDGYDNAAGLPMSNPEAFVEAVQRAGDNLAPHIQSGQILLMAGNDHQEPDARLPGLIAYAKYKGRLGDRGLLHSSLSAYVTSVSKALAGRSLLKVEGELRSSRLHHLLPGVLSARMWIKQRNDAIETLLTSWAEPFAAWAELLDSGITSGITSLSESPPHLSGHEPLARVSCPAPLIRHAWRILLENHPHDSICGCSVDQIHREMDLRFDQAEQIAEEITTLSLAAIAERVDPGCGGSSSDMGGDDLCSLVVFNPTEGPRTDLVTTRLCLPAKLSVIEVVDHEGRVLPHQVMTEPLEQDSFFFHREIAADEMKSYLSLVRGGWLLNHIIHQVRIHCDGDEAEVLLTVGKRGWPDRGQVAVAQRRIEELVAQGKIRRFTVHANLVEPSELTFIAPDLPPYGYAAFYIRPARRPAAAVAEGGKSRSPASPALENDLFTLLVDPSLGTVTLTDKVNSVVYRGLNHFVDGGDRGDAYNYCPPEEDRIIAEPLRPPHIRVVEEGPVRQTLEIAQLYRLPCSLRPDRRGRIEKRIDLTIVSRINLFTGLRRVEFETEVDNQVQDHRLRVHFPVPWSVDHAHTESHFHVVCRPVPQVAPDAETGPWKEQPVATVPQRGWADISNGRAGLMVANRGLPEVEFIAGNGDDGDGGDSKGTIIALTLLRCVGWLSRDDLHCRRGRAGSLLPMPGAQCPGRHIFHYSLIPHSGRWENARSLAEAFRAPLRAVAPAACSGTLPRPPLPPRASLVRVEPSSFVLTTIKEPEDNVAQGLIVRGVNLSNEPVNVHLRTWQAFDRVTRTNLNEEHKEFPITMDDNGLVSFHAHPWEIVSLKIYCQEFES